MTQKIMKCGFVGGLILFIWGAVAWTILPWQKSQFKSFDSQKSVRFTIKDNAPVSGIYTIPSMNASGEDSQDAQMQMAEGPYVFAVISAHGKNPNMLGPVIQSLILKLVAACLVAWLLFQTKLHDFNATVKFVTTIGFLFGLMATLPYVFWFGFPGTFAISGIIEAVIGWFFAGLAMAKLTTK